MRRIHRRGLAAALFSLLLAPPVAAEAPADLDSVVARAMKVFEVPGIGLAIVQNHEVVLTKGYGVRALDGTAAADERTLFGIASNTKAFTAVSLTFTLDPDGRVEQVKMRAVSLATDFSFDFHDLVLRPLREDR